MFKDFAFFSTKFEYAHSDLCAFFSEHFYPENIWKEAEHEAQKIDATFPQSNNAHNFISEILPWLEERKRSTVPISPWEVTQGNLVITNTAILMFLNDLKSIWLTRLLMPGPYVDIHQPRFYPDGGRTFKYFCKFVGEERITPGVRWRVILRKKSKERLKNFVSWLVVSPSVGTLKKPNCLIIVIDMEKIQQKLSHRAEFVSRFERVVLHELGHARIHIDWYLKQLANGIDMAESHPTHELEAWIYSLAIRTYVVSVKSWITRILSDQDDQWMHP